MNEPIKILVVDDSALYRQSISNILRQTDDVVVVGGAGDGKEAMEKIAALAPDLLTLDVQMPEMDGIAVLREIKRRALSTKAIMVSSFTAEGAQVTTDALLEGAFDFVLKPSGGNANANRQQLAQALTERVSAFRESRRSSVSPQSARRRRTGVSPGEVAESAPQAQAACQAVLIGASTGGPAALKTVLSKLPAGLQVPVFVVQHMPPRYTRSLAERLDQLSELQVQEAVDGNEINADQVLIAPGGRQMKLVRNQQRIYVQVTEDEAELGCRPSIDYLLRSAIRVFDGQVLAVIMTGMGRDGAAACAELKASGGHVFAQDEESCVVYGMPKVIIDQELADRVLPLGKIAPAIVRYIKRSQER